VHVGSECFQCLKFKWNQSCFVEDECLWCLKFKCLFFWRAKKCSVHVEMNECWKLMFLMSEILSGTNLLLELSVCGVRDLSARLIGSP